MNEHRDLDRERVDRERDFHNRRFADDTRRHKSVGRFYELTGTISARYRDRILSKARGATVLEFGVGTGSNAFALAQHGALVTGIDISSTAIAIAGCQAVKRGLSVDFCVMNAEQLDFEDNSFDMICGTGILHHLDLGKAVPEIRRVLKPGGVGIFFEPLGHNFLINSYRRLTPTIRSVDEHPLVVQDLRFIGSHFAQMQTEYFGLLVLASAISGRLRRSLRLRRFLEAVDKGLFIVPWLRRQAWIVVLEVSGAAPS